MTSLPIISQDEKTTAPQEKENFFWRTVRWVDKNFVIQDTIYSSPNRYNLFVMPAFTHTNEYYRFASKESNQSITLRPNSNNSIGINFGWRWISIGYSINLSKSKPDIYIDLGLYTSGLGLDLLLHKRSEGLYISKSIGISSPKAPYNEYFRGFSITQGGARLFYIFNYKRFSFPAAYSHSTNQRINAGSFIIGATYHQKIFNFDYTRLDDNTQQDIETTFKFKEARYMNISINTGYSYNLVFAKDFVANISLFPAIGYKGTDNNSKFIQNINFDVQTRLAVVYNNQRYFAGLSCLSYTYFYNNSDLRIIQGTSTLKVYVGYNFWRRKKQ